MSFQDIETGLAPSTLSPQSREDAAFLELQSSLSLQVFKINANVQGIRKLVEQLGTVKDSATLRKSLHDLTETTRAMAKRGSDDLKKLAVLQMGLPNKKTALQKTSNDLESSLVEFQRAQKVSVERQRTVVQGVRMAVDDSSECVLAFSSSWSFPSDASARQQDYEDTPEQQRQVQILQQQLSPHELAYQESLIQEREQEIREIESGIHELAEIFHDLGTLVHQQGGMLDNIESNISSVAVDVSSGADELRTASDYQRRAGRRAACLMIVLVLVTAVVLLAVSGAAFLRYILHYSSRLSIDSVLGYLPTISLCPSGPPY
ncbi:t-SNARE [Mycena maculata]|uniref:t-SNARE n=1 Tax=Mycena maculata TaxID=230809 RepID=A0AAD7NGR5_9AGAR|nr:t-SNARE [Mycena maculata]